MFVDRWVRGFEHPDGSYRDSKRLKFPSSNHEFRNPGTVLLVPAFGAFIIGIRNKGSGKIAGIIEVMSDAGQKRSPSYPLTRSRLQRSEAGPATTTPASRDPSNALLAGRREDPATGLGRLGHRRESRAVATSAFDFRRHGCRLHVLHGDHFLDTAETGSMSLCRMDCSPRLSHVKVIPDQVVSVTVP